MTRERAGYLVIDGVTYDIYGQSTDRHPNPVNPKEPSVEPDPLATLENLSGVEFGMAFKEARISFQLNQGDFSSVVTQPGLSEIEMGKRTARNSTKRGLIARMRELSSIE